MVINISQLLKSKSKIDKFTKGQVIVNDGDLSDNKMYIILDGSVGVYKNYKKNGELHITTLSQGDFFGEMSLFLKKERTATIVAREDLLLFVIDRESVMDFLVNQQDSVYSLIQTLCQRLDSTNSSAADDRVNYDTDIKTLINENSKMDTLVNTDVLTGAYNRRYFREVAKLLVDAAVSTGSMAFIAIFDLDHFKKVNDTYGHDAGDYVLITFSNMVRETINSDDLFARYGGEEFILFVSCQTQNEAMMHIDHIRQKVCQELFNFNGTQISVSTSVGVTSVSAGDRLDIAASIADAALYKAKNEGRNKTVFL